MSRGWKVYFCLLMTWCAAWGIHAVDSLVQLTTREMDSLVVLLYAVHTVALVVQLYVGVWAFFQLKENKPR